MGNARLMSSKWRSTVEMCAKLLLGCDTLRQRALLSCPSLSKKLPYSSFYCPCIALRSNCISCKGFILRFGVQSTETQNRISMISSGMIGMIRRHSYLQDKHDRKRHDRHDKDIYDSCHHLCPYHAYHAACDHAYPVLRSVLCALYSQNAV